VHVMLTETCPAKWSEVVQTYSPRRHHDVQFIADDDTMPPSQLDSDDDEQEGAGSSDGVQPAARGRYGRRYDPSDPLVIVERPTVTQRTGHSPQVAITTSGASISTRPCLPLSVDVQLALPLLKLDWTTAPRLIFSLFHCCFDCLSATLAVTLYSTIVSQ